MGTFKEFLERLQSDEEFSAKIHAEAAANQEAGETEAIQNLIAVAKENGYAITEEEIHMFNEQQKETMAELSEEEMGKVAGGTGLFPITMITATAAMAISVIFFDPKKK